MPSVTAKDARWTLEQIFLTNTGLNLVTARVAPLTRIEGKAMLWIEYANKGVADVGLALVQSVPGCKAVVLDWEGQVQTWGFKAYAPVTKKLVEGLLNGEWF